MAYISSNANRWYCAKELSYGVAPTISAANRIPAVKLSAHQQVARSQRKDKTGSRTWAGNPTGMRRQTTFNLTSYMRDWPTGTGLPAYGPLFEAVWARPACFGPEAMRPAEARRQLSGLVRRTGLRRDRQ